MAGKDEFRQDVRTGDHAVVVQQANNVNYFSREQEVLRKIENPELFYLPPRPRKPLSDAEQESNIQRKMKKFGDAEVGYAQQRRADILVILAQISSVSEFSQQHLEWVMRNLEDWYRRTYVALVRINPQASGLAYKAVLDGLDDFANKYNHERLPLNSNVLIGLLFNATGLCDIDWKGSEGATHL